MSNNMLRALAAGFGLIFVIGCASSGVEVRRYVEVRDRVDQEMQGNAGYLSGTPQPDDRSNIRKRRKVYVMEFSQGEPVPQDAQPATEQAGQVDMADGSGMAADEEAAQPDNYIEVSRGSAPAPFMERPDSGEEVVGTITETTEYTVKKDDTLQKIAKKFYNSYSKWPKIYEANKDVIDNPNRIKPGIVLKIPAL